MDNACRCRTAVRMSVGSRSVLGMTALRVVEPSAEDVAHSTLPAPKDSLVLRVNAMMAELREAAFDPTSGVGCGPDRSDCRDGAAAVGARDRRWPSRCGSPGPRSSGSWRRMCIRRRSVAGSPSRLGWLVTSRRGRRPGDWGWPGPEPRLAEDISPRYWPASCGSCSRGRGVGTRADAATRARVDAELAAAGITGLGYRQAVACADKHATTRIGPVMWRGAGPNGSIGGSDCGRRRTRWRS